MSFAGKVWRFLVGVKDGLSLILLLLFFTLLFSLLSARPNPGQVREGALLMKLDGAIVEEASEPSPISMLLSGTAPVGEYPVRDIVESLDAAADDDRIKAVVLDLSQFLGGGQVHLQAIGEAMDRVRAAKKPVLTYAYGYADSGMMLAAHGSEVWLDPLGGAVIAGPGGTQLYYKDLIDKLGINARVYRVGTYKAAVEPYLLNSMSEDARENFASLYGSLWEEWQANVKKSRPKAQIDRVTREPVEWVTASGGDMANAALDAGLVDKLGTKVEFGNRVAQIVGEDDWDNAPGNYAFTDLDAWIADLPGENPGKSIGVITIAGNIVDGDAGPGTAGGSRIADLLDDALDDDLAGLVVRVNSPGGSVTASEDIRLAILRHKAKGIPVAVSMGNVAASGGYWVSTPADRIFAQPETVTGSIGIFAVVPTFEGTAAKLGVNADGFRTTPLSGQPDLVGGFTPEIDAILQSNIDNGYKEFVALVAKSRKMTPAKVDTIAQGRVWDGGTARQIGLIDQFGGLEDALEWTARQAKLEDGGWHAQYLGGHSRSYDSVLRSMFGSEGRADIRSGDVFAMIGRQQSVLGAKMLTDLQRLDGTRGMQAYCLECPVTVSSDQPGYSKGFLTALMRFAGL